MVDRRPPETVAEIAARTGRPLTTVSNTWTRHPAWPKPLEQRRGRWRLYDPEAVDVFLRAHVDREPATLKPNQLYTAQQLEDAGIGVKAGTIRADLSRGRWPAPDQTTDGAKQWRGSTVAGHLAQRRAYRKVAPSPDPPLQ